MPKQPFEQLSPRKRKAIYKVCLELYAQHGFSNTSIKMITKRLRVADGYLYYYFDGKEDLARWVIESSLDIWRDHFEKNVETHPTEDLFEFYKLTVIQMAHFTKEHPDLFGAYVRLVNEPDFPLADFMNEKVAWIDEKYVKAIVNEVASGRLRTDISPALIAMVLDVVNTRVQEYFWNPNLDLIGISKLPEKEMIAMIDKIISLLRDGMRSPAVAQTEKLTAN